MPIWMIAAVGGLYAVAGVALLIEGKWQMSYLIFCYAVASHALILVQRSQG